METTFPSDALDSPGHPAPTAAEIRQNLEQFKGRRVAVAMSGGVDSAVAAYLLKEAGAEVIGLSLRLHDPDPCNPMAPRACCPPDDLQDARRVAEGLEMPFYVIDGRKAFDGAVVQPFVDAYLEGRTPNPCVGCNSFVKLSRLHRRSLALGCDALATGHYARLRHPDGAPTELFTGLDVQKDQSYFLFGTDQQILSHLLFPLGAMSKAEVRDLALSSELPVAHKLESQEVCFVGGAGAGKFVMRQEKSQGDHAGEIRDESGKVLGTHPGVMNFTIGQRKGIGIAARRRLHVLNIDADSKTIVVGEQDSLLKSGLKAGKTAWPSGQPEGPLRVHARIRYRDKGAWAMAYPGPDNTVELRFEEKVRAVAPGQAVVMYQGAQVVGGGWIEEAIS